MTEDKKILRPVERPTPESDSPDFLFWCPGCQCGHGVWTTHPNGITGATWTWNGSMEKPTFQPSILVSGTVMSEDGWRDYREWQAAGYPDRNGKAFDSKPMRCHSVVTDGIINYCSDSTHALSGKSVPMEAF